MRRTLEPSVNKRLNCSSSMPLVSSIERVLPPRLTRNPARSASFRLGLPRGNASGRAVLATQRWKVGSWPMS